MGERQHLWPTCDEDGWVPPADESFRALHRAVLDLLRHDGMSREQAMRVSLRTARVRMLSVRGHKQTRIAQALGCSERTVKYDEARVRRVLTEGWLASLPDRLDPIPRSPEDRVAEPLRGGRAA